MAFQSQANSLHFHTAFLFSKLGWKVGRNNKYSRKNDFQPTEKVGRKVGKVGRELGFCISNLIGWLEDGSGVYEIIDLTVNSFV